MQKAKAVLSIEWFLWRSGADSRRRVDHFTSDSVRVERQRTIRILIRADLVYNATFSNVHRLGVVEDER